MEPLILPTLLAQGMRLTISDDGVPASEEGPTERAPPVAACTETGEESGTGTGTCTGRTQELFLAQHRPAQLDLFPVEDAEAEGRRELDVLRLPEAVRPVALLVTGGLEPALRDGR